MTDRYLTRRQVGELLNKSYWTLLQWEKAKIGPPCIRIGPRTWGYSEAALQRWLAERSPTQQSAA